MTRDEALQWLKEIASGAGVDRYDTPVLSRRGTMAVRMWDEGEFVLGLEYGAMIALARAFDLTAEEIGAPPPPDKRR